MSIYVIFFCCLVLLSSRAALIHPYHIHLNTDTIYTPRFYYYYYASFSSSFLYSFFTVVFILQFTLVALILLCALYVLSVYFCGSFPFEGTLLTKHSLFSTLNWCCCFCFCYCCCCCLLFLFVCLLQMLNWPMNSCVIAQRVGFYSCQQRVLLLLRVHSFVNASIWF